MKNNKKKGMLIGIISIVLILVGIFLNSLINPRKPGLFQRSEYDRGSKSITVYEDGKEIIEYKWFKRKEIVKLADSLFNNYGENLTLHIDAGDQIDEEKYTVLFDFNNTFAKIYVNKEDKTVYMCRHGNAYKRQLSDKEYDTLMSYVKEEQ